MALGRYNLWWAGQVALFLSFLIYSICLGLSCDGFLVQKMPINTEHKAKAVSLESANQAGFYWSYFCYPRAIGQTRKSWSREWHGQVYPLVNRGGLTVAGTNISFCLV